MRSCIKNNQLTYQELFFEKLPRTWFGKKKEEYEDDTERKEELRTWP